MVSDLESLIILGAHTWVNIYIRNLSTILRFLASVTLM